MSRRIVEQVLAILAGPERGGPTRLAEMLKMPRTRPYAWRNTGRIPAKWQPRLLELARERGLPLRPEHFFEIVDDPETGQPAETNDKRCVAAAPEPTP